MTSSNKLPRKEQNRTPYILDAVCGLLKEKYQPHFRCLKKCGFLKSLSKYALSSDFNTFSNEITHLAKRLQFPSGSAQDIAIRKLKEHWDIEIEVIRMCYDCYDIFVENESNKDHFTLVCSKPHLLVHVKEAKHEGPRLWPAKVLSVNEADKMVTVQYFGDRLLGDYVFENCLLYSEKQEIVRAKANEKYSKNPKLISQEEYLSSFTEVQKYIENIKTKFGSFVPAAAKTKITNFEKHLKDMFPGAFQQVVTSSTANVTPFGAEITSNDESDSDSDSTSDSTSDSSSGSETDENCVDQRVEIPPISIKTEPNDESAAVNGNNSGEQGLNIKTEKDDGHEESIKRKNGSETEQSSHATKKVCADFGHSSQANVSEGSVITIDDESVFFSTPIQSPNESTNARKLDEMLDVFGDVKTMIAKYEEQLENHNEQEIIIRGKFRDIRGENSDELLNEFREVIEKRLQCINQLKELKEHEDTIRAELRKTMK